MKQGAFGYTLVEVMIVLAISGVLLVSAIVLFSNQTSRTSFQTGLRDLDSKIQSWVGQVGTDYFPEIPDMHCELDDDNRPALKGGARDQGASEDCIFLGHALLVKLNSTQVEAYTVLGASTQKVGGSGSDFVTDFAQANPTLIFELTEQYDIPNGAAILKETSANRSDEPNWATGLVGFYSNPQGAAEGNQPVLGKAYGWVTHGDDDEEKIQEGLKICIEGRDRDGNEDDSCLVEPLKTWDLCFENSKADSLAVLGMAIRPGGIGTTLKFNVAADDPLCVS